MPINQKEARRNMANLTEKELSALNDLLSSEELEVKKFRMLANSTADQCIRDKFNAIADKHQQHFNMLYNQLN
jgi:hypothetical protein